MYCAVCAKKTEEYLVYETVQVKTLMWQSTNHKKRPLCRDHLFSPFIDTFVNFPHKLVVFHPGLEGKGRSYTYSFSQLRVVRENPVLEFDKVLSVLDRALNSIVGTCRMCTRPAQAAYYPDGALPYVREGWLSWEKPLFTEIKEDPTPLCLHCTLAEIMPSLRSYSCFTRGLWEPYGGEGILLRLMA
jgi:hypothetical protein